ncbi:MAG: helix-turn-helix domain-containing protein [Actinobacteria bacterium]|nr:helix-turn-helix domain-containing protein [Actinomycetota bacterium]
MVNVGKLLKGIRNEKGYSIRKVSDETGFSVSFLSKLENGKTSITIRNLIKLLDFYDVTLSEVFTEPLSKKIAYRKEERKRVDSSEGVVFELLVDDKESKMEPYVGTFQPRSKYESRIDNSNEGFALVITGEFRFEIDENSYLLREGDCAYFPGEKAHRWENLTDDTAAVLVVNLSLNP